MEFFGTFFFLELWNFFLGSFVLHFLYQVCKRELLLLHCGVCLLQEAKFLSVSSIWVLKFSNIEPIGRFPPSPKEKEKKGGKIQSALDYGALLVGLDRREKIASFECRSLCWCVFLFFLVCGVVFVFDSTGDCDSDGNWV